MNDTIIQATPTSRREGKVMGIKGNSKRLLVAAIAIIGVAGSSVAVRAATFGERKLTTGAAPVFGAIPMTCGPGACPITLYAGSGSVSVPDTSVVGGLNPGSQTVDFLGFGVNTSDVSLAGGIPSIIKVPVGTDVSIHLNSTIGPVDLSFPSIPGVIRNGVDNNDYSFTTTADMVGTSVFQPGPNPDPNVANDAPRQVAQGLVGVLIVTPTGCDSCAYDAATPYDDEVVVATTDLDAEFAADPVNFDMSYYGQSPDVDGNPRQVYHLINGKPFPDSDVIDVRSGDSLLIRSVNAGVTDKSMGLLGLRQTLLARNSRAYADPQTFIAPLIGPGETADIVVAIPDTTPAGQMFSLMDQGRQMNHGTGSGFGGALTFIDVWPPAAPAAAARVADTTTTTEAATSTTSAPTKDSTTTTSDPAALETTTTSDPTSAESTSTTDAPTTTVAAS